MLTVARGEPVSVGRRSAATSSFVAHMSAPYGSSISADKFILPPFSTSVKSVDSVTALLGTASTVMAFCSAFADVYAFAPVPAAASTPTPAAPYRKCRRVSKISPFEAGMVTTPLSRKELPCMREVGWVRLLPRLLLLRRPPRLLRPEPPPKPVLPRSPV